MIFLGGLLQVTQQSLHQPQVGVGLRGSQLIHLLDVCHQVTIFGERKLQPIVVDVTQPDQMALRDCWQSSCFHFADISKKVVFGCIEDSWYHRFSSACISRR
nr:MAG TPA: hypothetical protein [Caudoviricetes sp.]